MINSNVFDYINVMGKTADASWKRNEILSNNIANVDTPRYKRQDINFEAQLRQALGNSRYESVDDKVSSLNVGDLFILMQRTSHIVLMATTWILIRRMWSWPPTRSNIMV